MPGPAKTSEKIDGWNPIPDPDGLFSSGIADFDRLLGGGFPRGSCALFSLDETVGQEDLDLLLLPTFLNFLYQSRGIIATLPSRDSPHDFRARLLRFVTRRRFDSRVRVVDFVREDEGLSYVVSLKVRNPTHHPLTPTEQKAGLEKALKAEKAAAGNRRKPWLELAAFEALETLVGVEAAMQMFYIGTKRSRQLGNLWVGLLSPGLGTAAAARRMADTEFALRHDEVGLVIRGVRPSFPSHLVISDSRAGPPRVTFVPRPP